MLDGGELWDWCNLGTPATTFQEIDARIRSGEMKDRLDAFVHPAMEISAIFARCPHTDESADNISVPEIARLLLEYGESRLAKRR